MADSSLLLAALDDQARADPESPFLFWPEGWNWRWWSWRQVAELAVRWSAPLDGLRAGAGVAFAGDVHPQAIVLDLAVQAAGLTPVPLAGGSGVAGWQQAGTGPPQRAAGQAGYVAWLAADAGEITVTRLDGAAGGAEREEAAAGRGSAASGGPGVLVAGERGQWRRVPEAELLAAAARVESAIGVEACRRRDSRQREILVAGWPLRDWAGRLLAAWAVVSGAALVLESDPGRRLGTILWARPTLFHGSAAEVAAMRSQVAAARQPRHWRGWRRLPAPPLGRLRTLLQLEPPAPGEVDFWHQRGARLVRLPGLGGGDD